MSQVGKIVLKIKNANNDEIQGNAYLGICGCEFKLEKSERKRIYFENGTMDEFMFITNDNGTCNVLCEDQIEYSMKSAHLININTNDLNSYSSYIRFEPDDNDCALKIERASVVLHEYDENGMPTGNLIKYKALGITDEFITLDNSYGLFIALYNN